MVIIKAVCSCCGYEEEYALSTEESNKLREYERYGRQIGKVQDLFPHIPAWICNGAIDKSNNGFCICPNCSNAI